MSIGPGTRDYLAAAAAYSTFLLIIGGASLVDVINRWPAWQANAVAGVFCWGLAAYIAVRAWLDYRKWSRP